MVSMSWIFEPTSQHVSLACLGNNGFEVMSTLSQNLVTVPQSRSDKGCFSVNAGTFKLSSAGKFS